MAVVRGGVWLIVLALVVGILIGGAAVSLFAAPEETAPEEVVAIVESEAVFVSRLTSLLVLTSTR